MFLGELDSRDWLELQFNKRLYNSILPEASTDNKIESAGELNAAELH